MALFGDENEAPKVKQKALDHIADHFEEYYLDKIGLPYIETVGTGLHAKTITIETVQGMKNFLRGDEALKVFADSHELVALANIYNISFNIFSYGKTEARWNKIDPDKNMVSLIGSPEGVYPDVSLYHHFENHYDLLVGCDSSVSSHGLQVESNTNGNLHVESQSKYSSNHSSLKSAAEPL